MPPQAPSFCLQQTASPTVRSEPSAIARGDVNRIAVTSRPILIIVRRVTRTRSAASYRETRLPPARMPTALAMFSLCVGAPGKAVRLVGANWKLLARDHAVKRQYNFWTGSSRKLRIPSR